MLSIITCTGERPEAWALCKKMMARQTFGERLQWIIVDDGPRSSPLYLHEVRENWQVCVIRPEPLWAPGLITQHRNMIVGVDAVEGDKVLVLEDDDWYSPDYLAVMSRILDDYEICGEGGAIYYHVGLRKFRRMQNLRHASLCATGFRSSMIPVAREVIESMAYFIDCELWRRATVDGYQRGLFVGTGLNVGIKGLPGRGGIGVGHRPSEISAKWENDEKWEYLKKLVGDDWKTYAAIAAEHERSLQKQNDESRLTKAELVH